jgi:hypothetical protein
MKAINNSKAKYYHDPVENLPETGWDAAISCARQELDRAKFRVTQLKAALRILAEQKQDGVPWPRTH